MYTTTTSTRTPRKVPIQGSAPVSMTGSTAGSTTGSGRGTVPVLITRGPLPLDVNNNSITSKPTPPPSTDTTKAIASSKGSGPSPPTTAIAKGKSPEEHCVHLQLVPDLELIAHPDKSATPNLVCPVCFASGIRYTVLPQIGRKRPTPVEKGNDSFHAGALWGESKDVTDFIKAKGSQFKRLSWVTKPVRYNQGTEYHLVKSKGNEHDHEIKYVARGTVVFFVVEKGMNGETYHGLIAALLTNPDIIRTLNDCSTLLYLVDDSPITEGVERKDATTNQKDFLGYFLPASQLIEEKYPKVHYAYLRSRKMATKAIATFFRANKNHADIFAAIRNYLNDVSIATCTRCEYTTPAEIAAFYMNAYLKATKQSLLPSKGYEGTVVVIYVRTGHTASDKRFMTRPNLLICLKSTIQAFGENQGTIILMGDIGFEELPKLEEDVELPHHLKLLCVSSPFYPPRGKPIEPEVQNIWKQFQAAGENMPAELKYLGIYLAFRDRYGERLAVIGWRSGTLDGAAFLGIPVYSLDDIPSRSEEQIGPENRSDIFLTGQYLHRFAHLHKDGAVTEYYKRCYDLPTYQQDEDKKLSATASNADKHAAMVRAAANSLGPERMEELAYTIDNFILINVRTFKFQQDESGISYIPLSDYGGTAGNHLMTALKVFLMPNAGYDRPLWTQRLALMRQESQIMHAAEPGTREAVAEAGVLGKKFHEAGLKLYKRAKAVPVKSGGEGSGTSDHRIYSASGGRGRAPSAADVPPPITTPSGSGALPPPPSRSGTGVPVPSGRGIPPPGSRGTYATAVGNPTPAGVRRGPPTSGPDVLGSTTSSPSTRKSNRM